jgi:hypothetical protein
MPDDRDEYVLLGPVCAGKSTVGALLAGRLGVPHLELDELANPYYEAAPGFDGKEFDRLVASEGFLTAYRYFEPALPYAIERFVEEHSDAVLDLGAGHTSYLDRRLYPRAVEALSPFRRKILLLPAKDERVAIDVLRARAQDSRQMDWIFDGFDFIDFWVRDDQNRMLADVVLYTEDESPTETAARILELL